MSAPKLEYMDDPCATPRSQTLCLIPTDGPIPFFFRLIGSARNRGAAKTIRCVPSPLHWEDDGARALIIARRPGRAFVHPGTLLITINPAVLSSHHFSFLSCACRSLSMSCPRSATPTGATTRSSSGRRSTTTTTKKKPARRRTRTARPSSASGRLSTMSTSRSCHSITRGTTRSVQRRRWRHWRLRRPASGR